MTKPKKELSVDSEEWAHRETVLMLKRDYPDVIFRTDFAAGLRLPIWIAKKHAKMQSSKAFPDLFIYSPQKGYHGLAIELKAPGRRIKKQNGDWADDDCRRQNNMLTRLDDLGYAAYFASGYPEAKIIIDWYFGKGEEFITVGRVPVITKPVVTKARVQNQQTEKDSVF